MKETIGAIMGVIGGLGAVASINLMPTTTPSTVSTITQLAQNQDCMFLTLVLMMMGFSGVIIMVLSDD